MKRLTTEDFIKKAKQVYGDEYDYSKVNYVNCDTKVTVICKKHGEFKTRPDHFYDGHGCPKCGYECAGDKQRKTIEEFVEKAKKVHKNKYDYSKVEYKTAKTKVCIICPEHGEFWQTPDLHIRGASCPNCSHQSYKYTTEEFIKMAKQVHGDKYDYSKTEYFNRLTPVCIICPEHGEFWQKAYSHLLGNGCHSCKESKLEKEIKLLLEQNKIKFETQKRFDWLRAKNPMSLDFYLPEFNLAIECQGEQHFKDKDFFRNYSFEKRIEMDLLKNKLCCENGVKLLYYSSKYSIPKDWNKYDVICSKTKLLKALDETREWLLNNKGED